MKNQQTEFQQIYFKLTRQVHLDPWKIYSNIAPNFNLTTDETNNSIKN